VFLTGYVCDEKLLWIVKLAKINLREEYLKYEEANLRQHLSFSDML